jgi:hypothetical protein
MASCRRTTEVESRLYLRSVYLHDSVILTVYNVLITCDPEACCHQGDLPPSYLLPNTFPTLLALLGAPGWQSRRCETHGACQGYS